VTSALLFIAALACCGCTAKVPFQYTPELTPLSPSTNYYTVSVTVIDKRTYVNPSDKKPGYIGIHFGSFGQPINVEVENGLSLKDVLQRDVSEELRTLGFDLVADNAERKLVVTIVDYNFSCHIDCRIWHRIQIEIEDANGESLYKDNVLSEVEVEGNNFVGPKYAEAMPNLYAKMIRSLVRENDRAMAVLTKSASSRAE
jgi:hypothetical protein